MTKDRDYLIENLAMLIESGMDILSAVRVLAQEAETKSLKKILTQLVADVEGGMPFWQAVEKTKLLSPANVALVHIGEDSAHLAKNMRLIAFQAQKQRGLKSKMRSALMYPVIIMILTFVIGIGISWFILPKLAKVFIDLKIELPLFTRILLGVGEILENYGLYILPGMIGIGSLGYYVFFKHPKTRFIGQFFLFTVPVLRKILVEIEVARFGSVFGSLLASGLPLISALDSLIEATQLNSYKQFYQTMLEHLKEGDSFSATFNSIKGSRRYIPLFIQQIIGAGEKSGNLSNALTKIGMIYEEKVDETARNLTVLMEPIMLVIIWLGVVGAAMAVVMPIYNLIGNLNA